MFSTSWVISIEMAIVIDLHGPMSIIRHFPKNEATHHLLHRPTFDHWKYMPIKYGMSIVNYIMERRRWVRCICGIKTNQLLPEEEEDSQELF